MGIFSTLKKLFQGEETYKRKHISNYANSSKMNTVSTIDSSVDPSLTSSPDGSTRNQNSGNGTNFRYKDGRRYHGDTEAVYFLPNDDDEADRVHQQHWILKYALQGNYTAPMKEKLTEGINVLDSGCGPATWTFEMGETYPRSKIYGIDISCVFPENIMPPNVSFTIANVVKEIPFEDNFFDYVHQRLLVLGFTEDDWTNALAKLFRTLKPGGFIELAEPCVSELKTAGPSMNKLITSLTKLTNARNVPFFVASELGDKLAQAGFVDVEVKVTKIPLNHGGKVGQLLWDDYYHVYSNLRPTLMTGNPEWEDAAVYAKLLDACGEEAKQSESNLIWYCAYARKPSVTTEA